MGAGIRYLADFDSATAMLRALSSYLREADFPLLGAMPRWTAPGMKLLGAAVNALPRWGREQVYIWSGRFEAIAASKLVEVNAEEVAEWMAGLYPARTYPAVAIGSSNGAATHLWAALGIPWLPQTYLVPVARTGVHPDEPQQDVEWARPHTGVVLNRNPALQLHHMHDPVQDRLMIQRMSYFRLKRMTLGAAYERFLTDCLEPGGTIFVMDCRLRWPTARYGDRHVFQFGAVGGATVDELWHGGERVEEYLRRYRSHRRQWEPPSTNGSSPEAEWGFEAALQDDLERFARQHRYRVRRIIFEEPEDMSPLVADLYGWWNLKRGITESRLIVDSFILMEPFWTIRTGSVPFWMVFNKEPSLKALETYLDGGRAFDEIFLMLFSHGVESIGLPSVATWRRVLERARRNGAFVGVDEQAFPWDFAVFVRYYFDLLHRIASRYPAPPALSLKDLDEFLSRNQGRYRVTWTD